LTQLLYSKSNSNYMLRQQTAAIIRPHVSENVKRKLYSCSHTYDYNIYGRDLAVT